MTLKLLTDPIIKIQDVIELSFCEWVQNSVKDGSITFNKSQYYDYRVDENTNEVVGHYHDSKHWETTANIQFQNYMKGVVNECTRLYIKKIPEFKNSVDMYTAVKLLKYDVGDSFPKHKDHVHSIFDGTLKGIPVITVIGMFNQIGKDYDGGKFIFYDDKEVDVNIGEILMFPSNFLYPHQVTTVERGTRLSFVSWGF